VSVRAGEVVATTVAEFEAQCPQLHQAPPLGALVRVQIDDGLRIYGVVAGCSTDGVDMGARPVPRARDGCEDADVYRENPDLAYVLRTCFRSLVVGFDQSGLTCHYLPPMTAPIHYSVTLCSPDETRAFTHQLDYFRILLDARDVPCEEVLAAHVRFVATRCFGGSEAAYAFAIRAGREAATLLRAEHQRLVTILQRIRPSSSGVGRSMPA
jgi:hypothetical protein